MILFIMDESLLGLSIDRLFDLELFLKEPQEEILSLMKLEPFKLLLTNCLFISKKRLMSSFEPTEAGHPDVIANTFLSNGPFSPLQRAVSFSLRSVVRCCRKKNRRLPCDVSRQVNRRRKLAVLTSACG